MNDPCSIKISYLIYFRFHSSDPGALITLRLIQGEQTIGANVDLQRSAVMAQYWPDIEASVANLQSRLAGRKGNLR